MGPKRGEAPGGGHRAGVTPVERARTTFWRRHLRALAAGSMDVRVYETDYLAQSHWHGFRYRIGEMRGLDRKQHAVEIAPFAA